MSLINAKKDVNMVFLDLSYAFDIVNHRLLLIKLEALAIFPKICEWTASFYGNHYMRVRIKEVFPIGIPQTSVLCPPMFLTYINDLFASITLRCYLFADNVKLI